MLKVARESGCRIFKAPNGVRTGILAHPSGVSTLGAIFAIGGQDGKHSGETYVTLKSKVFEAIGSAQTCYRHGISTHVAIGKESSAVLLQFLPESSERAFAIFERLFDGRKPSTINIGLARFDLNRQALLGAANPSTLLQSLSYSASFSEPGSKSKVFARAPDRVAFNESLLNRLSTSCVLVGSEDEQTTLEKFSERLPKSTISDRPAKTPFSPGLISRARHTAGVIGDKVLKRPDNVDFAMSWEAPNVTSHDYFVFKVMEKALGGGSSFSSDGLGVGTVSSLLSKHVLYRLVSCEDIRANYFPYQTNGMFAVTVNVPADAMKRASRMIGNAIAKLPEIDASTVEASKEQAVLEYLKGLDNSKNRMVEFGNQILWYGEGKAVSAIVDAIRSVTKEQLVDAFKKTFGTKPTVAVIGNAKPESAIEEWKIPV